MLCEKCTSIFQFPEDDRFYEHHTDLASFTNAAASGCYFCEPLLQYAMKESGSIEGCLAKPFQLLFSTLTMFPYFSIILNMRRDGMDMEKLVSFLLLSSSGTAFSPIVRHRTDSYLPLSDASETAKQWIDICMDTHEQCPKNRQPKSYPTRLLELGETGLRLVLPEKEIITDPYVALSYCWGPNPKFCRLTDENYEELQQQGIPYDALPIAFREGIELMKTLSFRYLWIDALCIIQSGTGSSYDWLVESGKMQDVYSNCILNLSLSSASSPNESCLTGSSTKAIPPFQVEMLDPKGSMEYTVVFQDYYRDGLYRQPLGLRAWALQERLLSPRVLSFGHSELFWGCVQFPHASESLPRGLEYKGSYPYLDLKPKCVPNISDTDQLKYVWLMIRIEYTERALTYPERDKLLALSAIAARMGEAMNDPTYIAGHFWKMMPADLCWTVMGPSSNKRNEATRRRSSYSSKTQNNSTKSAAPSWSWASMDGPVYPDDLFFDTPLADPERYVLDPVDRRNMTGQVNFASLTMRSFCTEIEWLQGKSVFLNKPAAWVEDHYTLSAVIDDLNDEPVEGARCFLAALIQSEDFKSWKGLILNEVQLDVKQSYARIGSFELRSVPRDPHSSWEDDYKSLFGQERRSIVLI